MNRVAEIVKAWLAIKTRIKPQYASDEQIARATEAARIMSHPLMVEAVASIEAEYIRAWISTKPDNAELREDIHRTLLLLAKLVGDLKAVMADGEYVKKLIDKERAEAGKGHPAV